MGDLYLPFTLPMNQTSTDDPPLEEPVLHVHPTRFGSYDPRHARVGRHALAVRVPNGLNANTPHTGREINHHVSMAAMVTGLTQGPRASRPARVARARPRTVAELISYLEATQIDVLVEACTTMDPVTRNMVFERVRPRYKQMVEELTLLEPETARQYRESWEQKVGPLAHGLAIQPLRMTVGRPGARMRL
ncbi:hypothetical protein EJ02DRAFT_88208 [Clathrospora elynae]|uniref:Uncharacterized protein n=1 Tax=Clathrospora elynae TaxID=706981 RepID=A0A6A5SFZ7_9PLEO|nr:hypothetical protein EJ02DRAFT_88208 [Clathrospora elynae]